MKIKQASEKERKKKYIKKILKGKHDVTEYFNLNDLN